MAASMDASCSDGGMENRLSPPEDDDDIDEWIFSSIKKYDDLHMFDLQSPFHAIDWVGDSRVCVGCLQEDGTTELLELCLPDKLLASKTAEGLVADRDFNFVSGGFHEKHIHHIKYIHNDLRQVVTSELGENMLRLWNLGQENSDLCENFAVVPNKRPDEHAAEVCLTPGNNPSALFGSVVANVCMADLETLDITYHTSELNQSLRLSGLTVVDTNTFTMCTQDTGEVWLIDHRQPVQKGQHITGITPEPTRSLESVHWQAWGQLLQAFQGTPRNTPDGPTDCVFNIGKSADCHGSGDSSMHLLVRMTSSGNIQVHDLRNLQTSVWTANVGHTCSQPEFMNIQFAPSEPNILSVSGFDGNVYLYDISKAPEKTTSCSTLFTHQGHVACADERDQIVTMAHIWHPSQPKLLLSSANDGSFHAWSYLPNKQK